MNAAGDWDGFRGLLAGVDEAGRGPLAGDVVAAAVILDPARPIAGLADSKKLTAARREVLADEVRRHALAWGLGRASVAEIDALNILQATLLAMQRAVDALVAASGLLPQRVLVDGNRLPRWSWPSQAVVKGDARVPAISAASILAKVARDADMVELDRCHPEYGFLRHKGYPTQEHLEALQRFGASPCHRRSYAPVQAVLNACPGRC